MSGSYILEKRTTDSTGKRTKLYLSVTGKWVKSTKTATVKDYEEAKKLADQHLCGFRAISYKS